MNLARCSCRDILPAGGISAAVLAALLAAPAAAGPLSAHPVAVALARGDCDAAVDLVNQGMASKDGVALFAGARMLDEGICSKADRAIAARYYAQAAILGYGNASLEYAAAIGLGQGTAQNYEQAGEICRSAGLDPQSHASLYALGYSCTLRAVAGRLLRQTLVPDAFRLPADPAKVSFRPASKEMEILSMPRLMVEDQPSTGSILRKPRVKVQRDFEAAWRSALATVPRPDPARLDDQPIELPVDVDMTLEAGADVAERSQVHATHQLLPGEVLPVRISPSTGG